ncbi:MAG: hypothetical protein SOV58_00595 [Candidatus Enteromonas sp.]|nr:hypothetical protein [Candidatus Enteromonas sp.]
MDGKEIVAEFLKHWPIYVSLFLLLLAILAMVISLCVASASRERFEREIDSTINSSRIYILDVIRHKVRYFNVMSPSDISPEEPLSDFYNRFPSSERPGILAWINGLTDENAENVPDYYEIDINVKNTKRTYFSMLEVDSIDRESGIIHLQSYLLKSLTSNPKTQGEGHGLSSLKQYESAMAASSKRKGYTLAVRFRFRSIQERSDPLDPLSSNQIRNVIFPLCGNRQLLLKLDGNCFVIGDFHASAKPDGLRFAKSLSVAISRYLSLNSKLAKIDFRIVLVEHRLFQNRSEAILEQANKTAIYAFEEGNKVILYERGREAMLENYEDPSSTFRTEVERIVHDNKISVKFRPIFDVKNERVYGYLSKATPFNSYFESMKDLHDYAFKTGDDKALFSTVARNTIPTFLAENRLKSARLFLPVYFEDRAFMLSVLAKMSGVASSNLVFLFSESDVKSHYDPESDDNIVENIREIKAKGYEVGIFFEDPELSLPSSLYESYDYFVCGFGFAGSATSMDAKIRSKLHSLVEKLLKYKHPIIASDIEGWDAIEIIVRSKVNFISSDAFAPYDPMLMPPAVKSIRKIKEMKK